MQSMHQVGAIVVNQPSWRRWQGIALWGGRKEHLKLRNWTAQSAEHIGEMGNCEIMGKKPP